MIRHGSRSISRRGFLGRLGTLGLGSYVWLGRKAFALDEHASPAPVVGMRAPLAAGRYCILPLGSIRPTGWLRNQLVIQANGLSGHLDETWTDVGPESSWLGGKGESWERGPYFLDGLIPLAWLLDDGRLKAKAQRFVDWTLEHQSPNGMFGPASNDDWWPRFVMLKALTQYHELTGDERVIPLMNRYFRHQLEELPKRPLRDWGKFRWQDEVLSVIWLYNLTGAEYLVLDEPVRERFRHIAAPDKAEFLHGGLSPNTARPTRTMVAPSSIATSKSSVIPIESSRRRNPLRAARVSRISRRREKYGRQRSALGAGGGIAISPATST